MHGTLKLTDSAVGNVKLDNWHGGLTFGQYAAFLWVQWFVMFWRRRYKWSERHWARFLLDREEVDSAIIMKLKTSFASTRR